MFVHFEVIVNAARDTLNPLHTVVDSLREHLDCFNVAINIADDIINKVGV
jgi:hypothetical protein